MVEDSEGYSSNEEQNHYLTKDSNSNVDRKNNSVYESDYLLTHEISYSIGRAHKTAKKIHGATEIITQAQNENNDVIPLRVLLASGTSSSIVLRKFLRPIGIQQTKPVTWKTMGGNFVTRSNAIIKFKLPEFSKTKTITWSKHVDDNSDLPHVQYDMIIGTNMMEAVGIDLRFSTMTIKLDYVIIPMKNRGLVSDRNAAEIIFRSAVQSPLISRAEERHRTILDADYSAIDIDEYVEELHHLTKESRNKLKEYLKRPQIYSRVA